MYNQTASKAEQIAITQFIRDGHLSSQIRKSRKIHLAKAAQLSKAVKKVFQEKASAEIGETGFHVYVRLETKYDAIEIARRAKERGVAVFPQPEHLADKEGTKETVVMLNCANVAVEDYEAAMLLLKECL